MNTKLTKKGFQKAYKITGGATSAAFKKDIERAIDRKLQKAPGHCSRVKVAGIIFIAGTDYNSDKGNTYSGKPLR